MATLGAGFTLILGLVVVALVGKDFYRDITQDFTRPLSHAKSFSSSPALSSTPSSSDRSDHFPPQPPSSRSPGVPAAEMKRKSVSDKAEVMSGHSRGDLPVALRLPITKNHQVYTKLLLPPDEAATFHYPERCAGDVVACSRHKKLRK